MSESNIKHKMVVGMFLCLEDDAEDVALSLKEWFNSHEIGMDWHSVQITDKIDVDHIAS